MGRQVYKCASYDLCLFQPIHHGHNGIDRHYRILQPIVINIKISCPSTDRLFSLVQQNQGSALHTLNPMELVQPQRHRIDHTRIIIHQKQTKTQKQTAPLVIPLHIPCQTTSESILTGITRPQYQHSHQNLSANATVHRMAGSETQLIKSKNNRSKTQKRLTSLHYAMPMLQRPTRITTVAERNITAQDDPL